MAASVHARNRIYNGAVSVSIRTIAVFLAARRRA
jgi:hypothetical protein